jgi:formate C-acetyltransferase
MNERIVNLKKELVNVKPEICTERLSIVTNAYKEYQSYPTIIKRAMSLRDLLANMSIYIEKGQLIAGNQASKPRSAPLFPEYSWDWIYNEVDEFEHRASDMFFVSDENKDIMREKLMYWKGKTLKDRVLVMQSQEVIQDRKVGVLGWEGNVTAGEGHIILDFEKVLKVGFKGIKEEALSKLESLSKTEPEDLRKVPFYKAVIIVYEACTSFVKRYVDLAEQLSNVEKDPIRKKELQSIANNCKTVAKGVPKTFEEAIQLVYFVQLISQIEANGHSMSMGRVDQYLFPYYENDIKSEKITREKAKELVECFYLKLFTIIKLRSWSHTRFVAGYPTYQNIVVGGIGEDGESCINEMSYILLEALGDVRLSEPNFYIRCHEDMPDDFVNLMMKVIKMGFGMPALVNDGVIIESLIDRGVEKKDAYNYSTMGCLEVQVPGKWGYRANGKTKVNLLKIMEIALHGGVDPKSKEKTIDGIKKFTEFTSFDEVMDMYNKAVLHYLKLQVSADNINDLAMEEMVPDAFSAGLVEDCIGRGKTIKEGGAVYDMISGALVGGPNVGNSLFAIKKAVFDDKTITLEQLKNAMDTDFEGDRGERIRLLLQNKVEKYGNDNDEVDEMVREIYRTYVENVFSYKNTRYGRGPIGGNFMPSTVTISSNVPDGGKVGATPDGRKAFKPTAEGVSPMHGTEKNGPTSVINSVAKLDTRKFTGGQLLNMRFNPLLVQNREDEAKLFALIETFFSKDGWHVQFNMVSSKVLRDAQKHPENYPDLVIRVAGYSALFTALDKDTQDDIISRSEYEL